MPRELCDIIKRVAPDHNQQSISDQMKVNDTYNPVVHDENPHLHSFFTDDYFEEKLRSRVLPTRLCASHATKQMTCASERVHAPLAHVGDQLVFRLHSPPTRVLAFDIETTGLSITDTITCVSAYDPDASIHYSSSTPYGTRLDDFVQLLDDAPLLCAFNAVRFDIPFIARRWKVSDRQAGAWVAKLIDPFEMSKLAIGKTFSLNALLHSNGMNPKTGTGAAAVTMAQRGQWADLQEYCMADTVKTHDVVKRGHWILPTLPGRAT